jgi:hypothetical protein
MVLTYATLNLRGLKHKMDDADDAVNEFQQKLVEESVKLRP